VEAAEPRNADVSRTGAGHSRRKDRRGRRRYSRARIIRRCNSVSRILTRQHAWKRSMLLETERSTAATARPTQQPCNRPSVLPVFIAEEFFHLYKTPETLPTIIIKNGCTKTCKGQADFLAWILPLTADINAFVGRCPASFCTNLSSDAWGALSKGVEETVMRGTRSVVAFLSEPHQASSYEPGRVRRSVVRSVRQECLSNSILFSDGSLRHLWNTPHRADSRQGGYHYSSFFPGRHRPGMSKNKGHSPTMAWCLGKAMPHGLTHPKSDPTDHSV
jgi:hypothetical protein